VPWGTPRKFHDKFQLEVTAYGSMQSGISISEDIYNSQSSQELQIGTSGKQFAMPHFCNWIYISFTQWKAVIQHELRNTHCYQYNI
jgi:hypothetical protein